MHDLSFAEYETWISELGYRDGKKPDSKKFLKDAGIGTGPYVLKQRWNDGQAPEVIAKIRAKLVEIEQRRKEHTATGSRVLGVDEWIRLGEILSLEPDIFATQLAAMRNLAAQVEKRQAGKLLIQEAETEIAKSMGPFGSPTPEPGTHRK